MSIKYRPEIDGLRALAVIPVILFHSGLGIATGGYVGVDVFFVISGFLISSIIFAEMEAGSFSLLKFYERRARRILPALFFIMAICLPWAWFWMDNRQWSEFSESLIWTSFFSSNIFFWQDSDYFASAAELKPLLHTWSLAVEEQFYLIFPLLVMLLWAAKKRVLQSVLWIVGLASFALCVWAAPKFPEANFFLTPFRFWELLAGVFCAYAIKTKIRHQLISNRPVHEALSWLGLGCILYSILTFDKDTAFPSAWTLFPVLGSGLIILFADGKTIIGRLLSLRPFVFIGLISYSAYLWHHVIFAFMRIRFQDDAGPQIMIISSIVSLGLAGLTWKFIEQPFRVKKAPGEKSNWLKSQSAVFLSSGVAIALFAGTGALQMKGIVMPQKHKDLKIFVSAMHDIAQERRDLIGDNECDFFPARRWKRKWNCKQNSGVNENLIPVPIAILGDSHAADKAMILRIGGYAPMQYTGGLCNITPSMMTKFCRSLFDFAKADIQKNDNLKEIWLANDLNETELTNEAVSELIEYWKIDGKKVVFFAAMPHFRNRKEKPATLFSTAQYSPVEPNWELYEESGRPWIREKLQQNGFEYFDTKQIVCDDDNTCPYSKDGKELYYFDESHFTPLGAGLAAQRLLKIRPMEPVGEKIE